jgi:hypothetical protein
MSSCPTNAPSSLFASQSESCLQLSLRASAQDEGVSETRNSFPLMDNSQLKGGAASKQANRTKKIDARFTEDEYKTILELEKELGISKTNLVRTRVLRNAPEIIINAKDLIRHLDSIGAEMGRAGNNINQLARYANILIKKAILSPVVVERFNILFEQYLEHQKTLEAALRKIIRSMGY